MVFAGYAGMDYRVIKCSDGYALSGEYRSPVQDFGEKIELRELKTYAALFGQKITAIVETSNNNFSSVLESVKIELQDGARTYELEMLRPAQYARVRFLFQTSDTRVTPELHQFSLRGTTSNR
jgi:hypothetical protein